jgi:cobalt-zinc-cadmium resistance protein CzcA
MNMLRRLIEFSLSQRLFVLLIAAGIALAGAYAFLRIPIDAFPNIAQVQVKIILKAPGMTPAEVETRVVAPLEMELLGIPRKTVVRSSAKYAIADLTVDFEEGTDIYWARQQVTERFAAVRPDLPANISGGLAPISTPLSDVFMFTVEGDGVSLDERRTLLDWTIRPALRAVPGVADVNTLGGYVRAFEVVPDSRLLAAAGLGVADLVAAIEANNRNDGAGRLSDGEKALVVRSEGSIQTPGELEEIVLKTDNGRILRIGDVASAKIGAITRYGAVSRDGQGEAVQGLVIALRGADASAVVKAVRARLDALKGALPPGVSVHVFYDRADLIQGAVGAVKKALMEATVLVVLLLLVFLGDLRAAIVVAIALPMSALATFLIMSAFGMSANLMSLGGLAIAIGLIVDAAVVVVENNVERLGSAGNGAMPRLHLIFQSTAEVATPVASGIAIICLVFLPLLSLQGLEGKMFAPVALTIVFALSASLLLSLTLIPVLSSILLKVSGSHEPWLMRRLTPAYRKALGFSLQRPLPVVLTAVAGLVAAVFAYNAVGKAFMPTMDEGAIIMQTTKLPSINLAHSADLDRQIQKALREKIPEVERIVTRVGADELGLDPMGLNEADNFLVLKPREKWRVQNKEWLLAQLREVMAGFPGVEFAFTQPIEMRTSEMLTGSRGDLAIKIFGPDLATLSDLSTRIKATLAKVRGAAEVVTPAAGAVDYLHVTLDSLALGRAKLSVTRVQDELRALLEGAPGGLVIEGNRRTAILVRGPREVRESPEAFAQMQIAAGDGGVVRGADVAQLVRTSGVVKIDREDGSRFGVVQAYVSGRDLVGFVGDAQKAVAAEVPLPPGYRLVWGGQFENQQRAAARLAIVIPIALGLIFLMLFATLGSVKHALLVLANVPFALVGGMIALWISGEYLSVPASVGFIALLGVAVLNGLVLVSYFNQLLAQGASMQDAVFEGALRRLRPVLMTASIAALGLVPLLFAQGPGSEIQKPLAIVVIGGLITSTLLTLVLLPISFRRYGATVPSSPAQDRKPQWIVTSAD